MSRPFRNRQSKSHERTVRPQRQAYKMTDVMTAAGVPGRVELLLGGGHGWGGKEIQRSFAQTLEFFGEKLKHN